MKTEIRHTLVKYPGGGYDGCTWEWNFFYVDADGEFHCIEATGHAGCDTTEKADAMLSLEANTPIDGYDGPPIHTYDVVDTMQVEAFAKESNAVHVLDVFNWFMGNDVDEDLFDFFMICTECGERITEDGEGELEGWHGCGGIELTADALLCQECHSRGVCYDCGEYVGQSGFEFEQDVDNCSEVIQSQLIGWIEDDGPVCEDCWTNERDSLIAAEQQELLSLSLATGTPDLFGDDMRWFWAV